MISEFLFSESLLKDLARALDNNSFSINAIKLLDYAIIVSFAIMAIALVVISFIPLFFGISFLVFAACGPLIFAIYVPLYIESRRISVIDKTIPDLLLQASMFPSGTSTLKIIDYFSEGEGILAKEFKKTKRQINLGIPVVQALERLIERNKSIVLERAIKLFIEGYKAGADMSKVLKETAEDIFETQTLLRERVAALTMEKYTLLFAGALLVPALLAIIVTVVQSLDFSGLATLGVGGSADLMDAALLGNQIYLSIYAVLASVFVANQDGNIKKSIVYMAFLLPCALIVYNLILSIGPSVI